MSDKKDFPQPEPPNRYNPGTRNASVEYVENYRENMLKKFFFPSAFLYYAKFFLNLITGYCALKDKALACCLHLG